MFFSSRLLPALLLGGLFGCLLASTAAWAQKPGFDLTQHQADPKTLLFDDGETSVNEILGYYLEEKTTCCGDFNVYLEVKFDGEGNAKAVKALSGKNECANKSLVDLIKLINWDVSKTSQPIYINLKTSVPCQGENYENEYAVIQSVEPVPGAPKADAGGQSGGGQTGASPTTPQGEGQMAQAAGAQADRNEGGQTEQDPNSPLPPKSINVVQRPPANPRVQSNEPGARPPFVRQESDGKPVEMELGPQLPPNSVPPSRAELPDQSLPQPEYISAGELSPVEDHQESHLNTNIEDFPRPQFKGGPTKQRDFIANSLQNAGICGLAHVFSELTVETDGSVSDVRIFEANREDVFQAVRSVLLNVEFEPFMVHPTQPIRQYVYFEFKADILCETSDPNSPARPPNLDAIQNFLQQEEQVEEGDQAAEPAEELAPGGEAIEANPLIDE